MALKREIYRALEDILGPENVSEDPVILDSYAWRMSPGANNENFVPRFEAITLPADVKEVQAIVKLCNKHHLRFKASSSGWGHFNDPHVPGVVKLDLRRMTRIREINEKNMYAVVEPYVIGAQLQAELMKRGLNCNVTGAGGNCSGMPLAAHQGLGHLSVSGSYGERNLLAVEWVTPDGEIVRLGALGSVGEWWCGDGPGPSLRGIVRGNVVPLGGLGVFTAAATKVYHWPGPKTFSVAGVSPDYKPSFIPEGFSIRYISFPSADALCDAAYKVGESEIGFIMMGFNPAMIASNIARNNNEDRAFLKEYSSQVQGPGFLLIMAGNSPNDTAYKNRVLQQIMDDFGGKALEPVEDPENAGGFMWRFIRVTGSIREVARASGIFGGQVGATDVFCVMHQYILRSSPVKESLIKRGWLLDDGADPFVQLVEHGHQGHGELLIRYNPNDPNGARAQGEIGGFSNQMAIEGHFGVPGHGLGDETHDLFGPLTSNYHIWLRKIKKTFDPNAASEASHYITAKEDGS